MDIYPEPRIAAYVAALAAVPPVVYAVSTGSYTGYVSAASMIAIAAAIYVAVGPSEAEPQAG